MARYLIQAASNRREALAAPHDLAVWVRGVVEKLGGNLESLDYTIGEEDLVLIMEMPDEASMAAFSELASTANKLHVARVSALIRPEAARIALSRGNGLVEAVRPSAPPPVAEAAYGPPIEEPSDLPEVRYEPEPVYEEAAPAEDAAIMSSMSARLGDVPPGAYGLVAGRFTRFSELAAFSETVQALPGIQGVTIQQFLRGMVSMRIQYDSPTPLLTRLQELRQFKPEVREVGPAQYEMLIFAESRGASLSGKLAPASPAVPSLARPEEPVPADPTDAAFAEAAPPEPAWPVPPTASEVAASPSTSEVAAEPACIPESAPAQAREAGDGAGAYPATRVLPAAVAQSGSGLLHPAMVRAAPTQPAPAASRTRPRWGLSSLAAVFVGILR